ncbi:hypothetical protein [Cryptosporangium aurantiacum]|uniref:hypothetical protein n=1 Tax=Cryptosporangium aurantiacum TaxID=134849 RepID=UPI000933EAD7|nr:hypothetical protein [Cryptosporangium aurantiacum]
MVNGESPGGNDGAGCDPVTLTRPVLAGRPFRGRTAGISLVASSISSYGCDRGGGGPERGETGGPLTGPPSAESSPVGRSNERGAAPPRPNGESDVDD